MLITTFGTPDGELWGAALGGPVPVLGSAVPVLLVGVGRDRLTATAAIDTTGGEWRISGDGVELMAAPDAESVHFTSLDGFDQLGRLRGTLRAGGRELAVDCPCRRGLRAGSPFGEFASIRDVSTWFEPRDGLALTAVRPVKSKGHERDLISAAVLGAGREQEVADPRLSTTYGDDGWPLRAGIELWLSDDEEQEQYPLRAAGEAAGPGVAAAQGAVELRAAPLRCHSRGSDGAGVYLLVRRR